MVARAHQTLTRDRQRQLPRLRVALRELFPAALQAFDDLTAPDALELLGRHPIRPARRGCRPGRLPRRCGVPAAVTSPTRPRASGPPCALSSPPSHPW